MVSSPLLSLPHHLVVDQVRVLYDCVTVCVRSTALSAVCPLCARPATRMHSYYRRTIADLPSGGRQLVLSLVVRKFFCQTSDCPRCIFAERIADLVRPWARTTLRFCSTLEAIGFASSGEAGARLATLLGLPTSPATMLRRIKAASAPASERVTKVGIDDFAFRRGLKYGSILVDLETHQIIDLLPNRTVATATTWFKAHPDIKIVSRDRSTDYALAATLGAPQALQVADRWHLVRNLADALQVLLARHRPEIRLSRGEAEANMIETLSAVWSPFPQRSKEPARLARQVQRQDRYEHMLSFHQQGMETKEIAKQVGVSERTIRRWLMVEDFPKTRRRKKRSRFDAYAPYVLKRWQEGCHDAGQIWQELRSLGYQNSLRMVYSFLAPLRKGFYTAEQTSKISSKRAVWLLIRDPKDLNDTEQEQLSLLCQVNDTINMAYRLAQDFLRLVRKRQGGGLDAWLECASASHIPELQGFVQGIERDKTAVQAGLTLPYSNGVVEGQVHRLKLIKRMMYGRARFPLLRQRVLHAA
jgi:transposase